MFIPTLTFADEQMGYGKTMWGMSSQQVFDSETNRAIYIKPEKYSIGWSKVQIPNILIANSKYTVDFIFNNSDKLIQTNISSNEKENIALANRNFDALKVLLSQKYGTPQVIERNEISWKSGNTTIHLTKLIIEIIGTGLVVVSYSPTDTTNTDNL